MGSSHSAASSEYAVETLNHDIHHPSGPTSIPLGPDARLHPHLTDHGKGGILNYTHSVNDHLDVGVGVGHSLSNQGSSVAAGFELRF